MKKAILAMSVLSVAALPAHLLAQTRGEVDGYGSAVRSSAPATQPQKPQTNAMGNTGGFNSAQVVKAPRGEADYASMGAVQTPTAEELAVAAKRKADTITAVKNHETETDKP
jgi:hypothetical protein